MMIDKSGVLFWIDAMPPNMCTSVDCRCELYGTTVDNKV